MSTVKDLMTKSVITIDVNKTIFDAAELMSNKEIGDLIIERKYMPIGIVTERDFVRRFIAKKLPLDTKISEIMSKPLITIDSYASIKEAARTMIKHKIRRLPVLEKKKLVGIIVATDFAHHIGKKSITEEILKAIGRYTFPHVFER